MSESIAKKMRVLLSNNTGQEARQLAAMYPDQIGHCISPGGWRTPFPFFVIDNGRFSRKWTEDAFWCHLEQVDDSGLTPQWVAVPDVVGDHVATAADWKAWNREVGNYGWPLAYVVQDGCEPADVPSAAEVVFIGGSTAWKRQNIFRFCDYFPRVHVGRINTAKWLRVCNDAGAESCDGTGWFRGDQKQLQGLRDYLAGNNLPIERNLLPAEGELF